MQCFQLLVFDLNPAEETLRGRLKKLLSLIEMIMSADVRECLACGHVYLLVWDVTLEGAAHLELCGGKAIHNHMSVHQEKRTKNAQKAHKKRTKNAQNAHPPTDSYMAPKYTSRGHRKKTHKKRTKNAHKTHTKRTKNAQKTHKKRTQNAHELRLLAAYPSKTQPSADDTWLLSPCMPACMIVPVCMLTDIIWAPDIWVDMYVYIYTYINTCVCVIAAEEIRAGLADLVGDMVR